MVRERTAACAHRRTAPMARDFRGSFQAGIRHARPRMVPVSIYGTPPIGANILIILVILACSAQPVSAPSGNLSAGISPSKGAGFQEHRWTASRQSVRDSLDCEKRFWPAEPLVGINTARAARRGPHAVAGRHRVISPSIQPTGGRAVHQALPIPPCPRGAPPGRTPLLELLLPLPLFIALMKPAVPPSRSLAAVTSPLISADVAPRLNGP
jgi:hypothetical protein